MVVVRLGKCEECVCGSACNEDSDIDLREI